MPDVLQSILAEADASVRDVLSMLSREHAGAVFLVDGERRLLGRVDDRALYGALLDGVSLDDPAAPLVEPAPLVVDATADRADVLDLMRARAAEAAPVVEARGPGAAPTRAARIDFTYVADPFDRFVRMAAQPVHRTGPRCSSGSARRSRSRDCSGAVEIADVDADAVATSNAAPPPASSTSCSPIPAASPRSEILVRSAPAALRLKPFVDLKGR